MNKIFFVKVQQSGMSHVIGWSIWLSKNRDLASSNALIWWCDIKSNSRPEQDVDIVWTETELKCEKLNFFTFL